MEEIELIPVEGHNSLGRDPASNAIVNTDTTQYDAYIKARENAKKKDSTLEELQSEVAELKALMKDLIKIFKNIVAEGISILFVEQNVRLALSMADRGYVLESGRLVIDGKSEDLIDNEKVTKVFLGN